MSEIWPPKNGSKPSRTGVQRYRYTEIPVFILRYTGIPVSFCSVYRYIVSLYSEIPVFSLRYTDILEGTVGKSGEFEEQRLLPCHQKQTYATTISFRGAPPPWTPILTRGASPPGTPHPNWGDSAPPLEPPIGVAACLENNLYN